MNYKCMHLNNWVAMGEKNFLVERHCYVILMPQCISINLTFLSEEKKFKLQHFKLKILVLDILTQMDIVSVLLHLNVNMKLSVVYPVQNIENKTSHQFKP